MWTLQQTHLDCGTVTFKPDDFSDQVVCSYSDQLVHSRSRHIVSNDNGSGHFADIPAQPVVPVEAQ